MILTKGLTRLGGLIKASDFICFSFLSKSSESTWVIANKKTKHALVEILVYIST